MTDEQFDEYVDNCYEELEVKQGKMVEFYNIGSYQDYWFDQVTRTLQFKNNEKVELEFDIICIGTWAHKKNTWIWCWANKSFTDECRKEAGAIKELKKITGFDIFGSEGFDCNEEMAFELTAMGVKYLDALGMYRIPGEKSHLYVALMKENII